MSPVSSAGLNFSLSILDNTQLQAFKFLNFALIVKLTTASLFLISYIFKHMVQFKFSIFVLVAAAAAAVAPVIALPIGPGSVLLVTFLYGLTDWTYLKLPRSRWKPICEPPESKPEWS